MLAEQAGLLSQLAAAAAAIRAEAEFCDMAASFPQRAVETLKAEGLLSASLPVALGGMDFGVSPEGAEALFRLLYRLGDASLSVARIYEAHLNALQLILRYATAEQSRAAAGDAAAGHLFALWVTDPPSGGVVARRHGEGWLLQGSKAFCSAAGVASRALILAQTEDGERMMVVGLEDARVEPGRIRLGGMRGSVTGAVDFSGLVVGADAVIGGRGDYLREPVFSAGAWRGSAAALGALRSLLDLHRQELKRRERDADPFQRMRFGELLIAHETARLWTQGAARRACLEDEPPDAVVAYVNAARIAVERACLAGMQLTQRSLGISAFLIGHPAERLCRDLAVYLRQPAADEVLNSAATFFLDNDPPGAM